MRVDPTLMAMELMRWKEQQLARVWVEIVSAERLGFNADASNAMTTILKGPAALLRRE